MAGIYTMAWIVSYQSEVHQEIISKKGVMGPDTPRYGPQDKWVNRAVRLLELPQLRPLAGLRGFSQGIFFIRRLNLTGLPTSQGLGIYPVEKHLVAAARTDGFRSSYILIVL